MTKKKEKKTFSPIITLSLLIVITMIVTSALSLLNVEGSKTVIEGNTLETSIVVVNNIFTKNGLTNFFGNIITNLQLLKPLVLIILSLMATSILKTSGLLKHLFKPLKKVNPKYITLIVVFVGFISSFIGEYSYIILLPIVPILYLYLNKNPILGIITLFLGITLGYGTGMFYNYENYILGTLTQISATIDVDHTYKHTLYSNIYIMLASTILISILLSIVINKRLLPKYSEKYEYDDELVTSKKGLISSLIVLLISIVILTVMILPRFGGILLDSSQNTFVAKLLGTTAPFQQSFIYIYLLIVSFMGLTYGIITKNFKNNHEFGLGFTEEFNKVGYLFAMMVLISILSGIIDWTNIGVVITTKLINLLVVLNFSGFSLIVLAFIFIILMTILMPNNLQKWTLISPLIIPLFMRANISPDFTQFLFQVASGIGSSITPLFIYFIIMLGLMQKYDEEDLSVFKTLKMMLPIILLTTLFWLLLIMCFYVVGLPIGIGTSITM